MTTTKPTTVAGVNGTLFLDWPVNSELRYVARDDLGRIVATWSADVAAVVVANDLRTMGIEAGTRLTIRKEEVDLDPETGALMGTPAAPYTAEGFAW